MPIPRQPRGVRWIATQTATYDILMALFASVVGLSSAWNHATVQPAPLISRREIVSAPTSTIQVERISISEAHQAAITDAIREGRRTDNK